MVISLDVNIGGPTLQSMKLQRFIGALRPALVRGIDRATLILEREIKQQLSLGGRAPRRKGEARTKNTGDHLRIQDGNLRSSWTRRAAKEVPGGVEGHVATPVVYSAIHEFGGQAGRGGSVTIPKRPYVEPAIDAKRDDMQQAIVSEIMKPLL